MVFPWFSPGIFPGIFPRFEAQLSFFAVARHPEARKQCSITWSTADFELDCRTVPWELMGGVGLGIAGDWNEKIPKNRVGMAWIPSQVAPATNPQQQIQRNAGDSRVGLGIRWDFTVGKWCAAFWQLKWEDVSMT